MPEETSTTYKAWTLQTVRIAAFDYEIIVDNPDNSRGFVIRSADLRSGLEIAGRIIDALIATGDDLSPVMEHPEVGWASR